MANADEAKKVQAAVSTEEVENARAEIAEETLDDVVAEGEFEVTKEEMSIVRAELACEFPEDYTYMSDDYIKSVASKPYSKDPTIRRPLEYTTEKLTHVMEWREQAGAPNLENLVRIANGPDTAPEAVEDPDRLKKAQALVNSLNNASLYWHGLTKDGRPILWIRCGRKPWYPNVEAEVNALILLADAGIRAMPKGVTDFVVVSDSYSPPPPVPSFMISVLKALVRGYPDRLHVLLSAPVGSIIQFVVNLLMPLMPGRLAGKVVLKDEADAREILTGWLRGGEDDIPMFFKGKADHDKYYPEEGASKLKGQGTLKFDYFGMVERLQAECKAWEEAQQRK